MLNTEIHPSNETMIAVAIFEGPYESLRCETAEFWMDRFAYDRKAVVAIRGARDGEETSFKGSCGVVYHLRPASPPPRGIHTHRLTRCGPKRIAGISDDCTAPAIRVSARPQDVSHGVPESAWRIFGCEVEMASPSRPL